MKTRSLCALLAFFAISCAAASALDIRDVKTMVANNVSEAVIIGMIQSESAFHATAGDVAELRSLGASNSLVAAVTSATPATGEYVLADGSTAPAGTVIYEAPAVVPAPAVVTQPPTVYYVPQPAPVYVTPYPHRRFYHRPRPGISLHFGFGDSGRRYRRWR